MAWAKSPARRCGVSSRASRRSSGFAPGSGAVDGEEPRDDPFDIAVDRARRRVERDRRDGGGGIGADAGQRAQRRFARRKFAAVPLDHGAGAGVQVAGAGVIAEPGPGLEHVVERRRRERPHVAPARQEARIIRRDRLDRRLLQHDFGQPHAIRIGALAAAARATAARGDGGRTRRAMRWVAGMKSAARPSRAVAPPSFAATVMSACRLAEG